MMAKEIKIALIEDDDHLRFLIIERLRLEGYKVLPIADGALAEQIIMQETPDIVLLDWMLPNEQGSVICQNIRSTGFGKPVIMITAKTQDIDKIEAYNFGISDYITKPFTMDVLLAVIENKIQYLLHNEQQVSYHFAGMELVPNIHTLIKRGQKIELTILENRILHYFLKNKNKVVPRETLMQAVWGYNIEEANTRTVDMHIARLRKKVEDNPDFPRVLLTIRGIGYKLVIATRQRIRY